MKTFTFICQFLLSDFALLLLLSSFLDPQTLMQKMWLQHTERKESQSVSLWLCWSFCRNRCQQKHGRNTAEGLTARPCCTAQLHAQVEPWVPLSLSYELQIGSLWFSPTASCKKAVFLGQSCWLPSLLLTWRNLSIPSIHSPRFYKTNMLNPRAALPNACYCCTSHSYWETRLYMINLPILMFACCFNPSQGLSLSQTSAINKLFLTTHSAYLLLKSSSSTQYLTVTGRVTGLYIDYEGTNECTSIQ